MSPNTGISRIHCSGFSLSAGFDLFCLPWFISHFNFKSIGYSNSVVYAAAPRPSGSIESCMAAHSWKELWLG